MSKAIRVSAIIPLVLFYLDMNYQTSFEANVTYPFGLANIDIP